MPLQQNIEKEFLEKLQAMERRYKNMQRLSAFVISLLVIGWFCLAFTPFQKFELIRAKGIVIEDENGRDRILIGAPIPFSANRVRTDTAMVRKYWASQLKNPQQYMQWYQNYKHAADGIVFLNEQGFDVVQVGDNLSDANVGKRMFRASGILWNTQTGWERGGAGVNTTEDGQSRPTIGLDDANGEAIHFLCLEDGSKGLIIGGENGSLRIGMAQKAGELFQNEKEFNGIKSFDNHGKLIWEQSLQTQKKHRKTR